MRWGIPQWHQATSSSTRARAMCNTHSFQHKTATVAVLNNIDYFNGLGSTVEFVNLKLPQKRKGFGTAFTKISPFDFSRQQKLMTEINSNMEHDGSLLLLFVQNFSILSSSFAQILSAETISKESESIHPIWYRNKSAICFRSLLEFLTDRHQVHIIHVKSRMKLSSKGSARGICVCSNDCVGCKFSNCVNYFIGWQANTGCLFWPSIWGDFRLLTIRKLFRETMCMCTHTHMLTMSTPQGPSNRMCADILRKRMTVLRRSARVLVHTQSTLYGNSLVELPNVLSSSTIFIRHRRCRSS